MRRDSHIPFLLWVCTALLAHVLWSGGVEVAARVLGQLADIRLFAQEVREEVGGGSPIEVSLADEAPTAEPPPTTEPPPPPPPEPKPKVKEPEKPKPPEPAKPEPEKKTPAKPEPKPIQILPAPPHAPPPPPPPPPKDNRIAVKQHVKDKNQKDNPDAKFVGDEANKVKQEEVARATSHDRDDANPSFGGQKAGPTNTPGNSDHNKVGDSEEHPGDPNKAPGEGSKKDSAPLPQAPPAPRATVVPGAPDKPPAPPAPGNGVRQHAAQPPPPSPTPTAPPEKGDQGHDVASSNNGTYSLNPRRKVPAPGSSAQASNRPPIQPGLGLGKGPNDHGVQLNLNQKDVVAVVGQDELRRQRENDGERRRSAHRGSWQSSTFERWRPAIENYVSSVRPGNQTALNTARVPFATYLVAIHNKIHPIFADGFLDSLDALPSNNPMNDMKISTSLEIVLEREGGRLVRMGVTKTSGLTAFDIAALDSVYRSQPFGKPPEAILSTDGHVYLHWEFHRNPVFACSTMNARPYMLTNPPPMPGPTPPSRPPGQPSDPKERGTPPAGNGPRYGWLPLPFPGTGGS
jgi:hypothetical protein